jgi:hypothetical protein
VASRDVEVWRVDSPSRPCAYCRQDVGADPATSCPRCDAVYHPDCWDSNLGRCAVYGCEPAPKPPPPPEPMVEVPAVTRPAGGWVWLVPIFIAAAMSIARLGSGGSSSRNYPVPPPFPPKALRYMDLPYDVELLTESREAVVPALEDDRAGLLEEAQALEDSASSLSAIPEGRLTDGVRVLLRETVRSDIAALKRASKLYRRCEMSRSEPEVAERVVRVTERLVQKQRLLLDLIAAREPD